MGWKSLLFIFCGLPPNANVTDHWNLAVRTLISGSTPTLQVYRSQRLLDLLYYVIQLQSSSHIVRALVQAPGGDYHYARIPLPARDKATNAGSSQERNPT